MPKYKTRLTNAVMDIMIAADRSNLPYIEKKDIVKQVKILLPRLRKAETRVSQAIYQLQQSKKIKGQRIIRVSRGKYALIKHNIGIQPMTYWSR